MKIRKGDYDNILCMYEPDSEAERVLREIRDDNRTPTPVKSLYETRSEANSVHYRIDKLQDNDWVSTKTTDGIKYVSLNDPAFQFLQKKDLEARIEELEQRLDSHQEAFEEKILPVLDDFNQEIQMLFDRIS